MIWKVIEDFPNYEVSENGDVRRIETGRILKAHDVGRGYLNVRLYKAGRSYNRYAHRLVARAFLGEPPSPEHEVAHSDGIRDSNHWTNLRYATPKENSADRVAHGTLCCGERHLSAKLIECQVLEIRNSRETLSVLADRYGMGISAVHAARTGRTWKHVGKDQ